jgi:hypothetical protein
MIALGTEIILGEPAIDKLELFEVASIIASYPVKFVDKLCYVKYETTTAVGLQKTVGLHKTVPASCRNLFLAFRRDTRVA